MDSIPLFPTLYKLNTNGKLMQWDIEVIAHQMGGVIKTHYGQVDGAIQTTSDFVTEGKNVGKKNGTTALQQAQAEAKSKWERQQTIKGYVVDRERALRGEDDRQGFSPMLAKKYTESAAKIKWPAAQQPKLDGMRCAALVEPGRTRLYSRNGKPVTAVPHIEAQLQFAFNEAMIDGELYNHDLKDDFEKVISIVRKGKEVDVDQVMQYYIYDLAGTDMTFAERSAWLRHALVDADGAQRFPHLVFVETVVVENEERAMDNDLAYINAGYEASMLRNLDSLYQEDHRSFDLQKVKLEAHGVFQDEEFTIHGVTEGRGKLKGHAATFLCRAANGKEFGAKLKGETAKLKEYFENEVLWKDKQLTVTFQGYTKYGVPRFPVAKAIRDYE